jgi:HEAT repeat protein
MRTSLVELIDRMTKAEVGVNSDDSVSWHAHREAEKLNDLTICPELDSYLRRTPTKQQRSAAYFIVGKIGKNCHSTECAALLIAHIRDEKDKYALGSLLDSLADIPKAEGTDLTPVFVLLQDKRWLVRHAAIGSLKNTASAEAEDRLIAVLRTSPDPDDAVYCHATLNQIGTAKALPVLEAGLKSRKRDVKLSAKLAIEAIATRDAAQQRLAADAPKAARR